MQEIIKIDISELKFDNDINQLVPEMTEEEFTDLVKSIDEEGQRTPIHINKDNSVLDGRHRVRALQELNQTEISAIKEDMTKSEALKFVRDTAVKRRTLNTNQKLNVVLNTKDLIEELQEKSKENRLANLKQNKPKSPVEPIGKKVKTPVKENAELAKLAGVSETTLKRAKKVKKENPSAYEEVIKNNSGWAKAYAELPSVKIKKSSEQKEMSDMNAPENLVESPLKEKRTPVKRDRREEINARAEAVTPEEKNIMISETNAMNIINISDNLLHLIEDIENLELTLQFLKTQNKEDLEKVIKMSKAINTIIEKGDLQNV